MRLSGLLSKDQVETIHKNALRVLAEIGVRVEHEDVRARLTSVGGRCDDGSDAVRFEAATVEKLIAEAQKHEPGDGRPEFDSHVGVYQVMYLDPATSTPQPFDEGLLARYVGLAKHLPTVDSINILGVPFVPEGMSPRALPLAEKLYAWKHGIAADGTVQFTEMCEPLMEMFECHAAATGKKVEDVFCACGYLISPLRLPRTECEQLVYFAERGLRMGIGHLPSQGGSAPITAAGAITQSLAEKMFLFLLRRAFWGETWFDLDGNVSTIDMRRGAFCFGRPEQQKITLAFADLARFYGCACHGHTGLTDARVPSYEAGAQKAYGMLFTAAAVGHASMSAGLMSIDEVASPVQMVLDDDLVSALRVLFSDVTVDDVECAVDDIAESSPSGSYLGSMLTAERFKTEIHEPRTWSAGGLAAWEVDGRRIDVDRARDIVAEFERTFEAHSCVDSDEERELRAIIGRAVADE